MADLKIIAYTMIGVQRAQAKLQTYAQHCRDAVCLDRAAGGDDSAELYGRHGMTCTGLRYSD